MQYPKIPSLWKREDERPHRLMVGVYRQREVEYLSDCLWVFTEKVDGMNMRVFWDGHSITWKGRTDRAQIPQLMEDYMQAVFGTEAMEQKFEEVFGEREAVVFGEGYGAKIQSGGGNYLPDSNSLIVFDVLVNGVWLHIDDAENVAASLGLDFVPRVGVATIEAMSEFVKEGIPSIVAEGRRMAEGVVGKPLVPLRTRLGERIAVKIRTCDFEEE